MSSHGVLITLSVEKRCGMFGVSKSSQTFATAVFIETAKLKAA